MGPGAAASPAVCRRRRRVRQSGFFSYPLALAVCLTAYCYLLETGPGAAAAGEGGGAPILVHGDESGALLIDGVALSPGADPVERGLGIALGGIEEEEDGSSYFSLYWATGRSVKSRRTSAANPPEENEEEGIVTLVAGWVTVRVNLLESGVTAVSTQVDDGWALRLEGVPCEPLDRGAGYVECHTAHASLADPESPDISQFELRTPVGPVTDFYIGDFGNSILSVDPRPLVTSIDVARRAEIPVAIAVDASTETVYWANSAGEGSIERCSRVDLGVCEDMKIIVDRVGLVGDLAFHGKHLYFTKADSGDSGGGAYRMDISAERSHPLIEPLAIGYDRAQGIAFEPKRDVLFFSQFMGKIIRSDSASIRTITSLPTSVRMGGMATMPGLGLADDPSSLRLAFVTHGLKESSGVYASTLGGTERVLLFGHDQILWPRDVAVAPNGYLYVVTYLGDLFRIEWNWAEEDFSRDAAATLTALRLTDSPSRRYLESEIRRAQKKGVHSNLFVDSIL